MANSQASDLMSIGTHCAFAGCGQLDFLPFKCDACQRTYCLEHRSYRAHNCPQASGKDTQVIVCPLCAKSIRVPSNDDEAVAEAFVRHSATDCDPSNYQRVHNKKKCPVSGCKTKLTEANTYKCKKCGISVCMTHRFEKDHQCTGPPKPAGYHSVLGKFAQQAQAAGTSLQQQAQAAYNNSFPTQQVNPARAREVCPHCGARFVTVEELVAHVSSCRQAPANRPQRAGPRRNEDQCPYCGERISDPVALVRHVHACEYARRSQSRGQQKSSSGDCVIS